MKKKAKKKMQRGGKIPPVAKGVGDLEYARKMAAKRAGSKPATRRQKQRVINTTSGKTQRQVQGPDGVWRVAPDQSGLHGSTAGANITNVGGSSTGKLRGLAAAAKAAKEKKKKKKNRR